MAEADIQNCFYQIGVEPWLSEFFAFGAEDVSWIRSLGVQHDLHGNPLPLSGSLHPVFTVLPMGWSWSFWIVQQMHQTIVRGCGFAADRCLVAGWPAPSLSDGAVAAPYCDNIAIFGATESDANSGLARVLSAFERIGLAMHEVRHASLSAQPLGCHFDGARLRVGSKPEKLWRLRRAARL